MAKLPEDLKFSNPRSVAEFDDWPSGKDRVKCKFWVEHTKRGYRVARQTQKNGEWCKPKTTTFSGIAAIVDGSDGRTYILQVAEPYGFINVWAHDFMQAFDGVFDRDDRHGELLKIITEGQDPLVMLYPK